MSRVQAQRGLSALEIVFGVSIILLIILGLANAFNTNIHSVTIDESKIKAGFLTQEGLEAVRSMRDSGWSAMIAPLSSGTTYYFSWSNTTNTWSATTTATTTDSRFTRTIILSDVYRDINDDIAPSGMLDTNTKLVTVSVTWLSRESTSTRSSSLYLTNFNFN